MTSFQDSTFPLRQKEEELASSIIRSIKQAEPLCQLAYIPNIMPKKKVKYIFITMEPSFGRWAKDETNASQMLKRGFRNFLWSIEDFLFQYAISTYLSTSFYITDISKIAMLVSNAEKMRDKLYPQWINHLKEELEVFGRNDYRLFFVGNKVSQQLSSVFQSNQVAGTVLHYSSQAGTKRKELPSSLPEDYATFKKQKCPSVEDLQNFTKRLLQESNMDENLKNDTTKRLFTKKNILSESRIMLLFSYYVAFVKEKK